MISALLASIVEWILEKLATVGIQWMRRVEAESGVVDQAKNDEKNIEGSQTDEDRSKAVSSVIDHTF